MGYTYPVKKFFTSAPRVVIVLSTAAESNRGKLAGIFRYVRLHTPWNVRLIDRVDDTQTAVNIRGWQPTGMIVGRLLGKIRGGLDFGVPAVVMDAKRMCYSDLFRRASFITCDQRIVAEKGAEYLARKGFVRFAYLADAQSEWSVERSRLFSEWAINHGYACSVHVCRLCRRAHPSDDWVSEQNELLNWLKALPRQTAIFVSNDRQARELLELCQLVRLNVPSDVAVLGCDNDELLCENTTPSLSSVEPDFASCGYRAAELLDRLMCRAMRNQQLHLYGISRIVERESSQFRVTSADPRVCRGREFIRLNASRYIGVCDVADHMRVSRRMAEVLFRKQLDCSINAEIQRVRVDRLKGLLSETDRTITVLCQQCGYRNEAHVKGLFKRLVGQTMSQFRAAQRTEQKIALNPTRFVSLQQECPEEGAVPFMTL